jgi:hypothetical protein
MPKVFGRSPRTYVSKVTESVDVVSCPHPVPHPTAAALPVILVPPAPAPAAAAELSRNVDVRLMVFELWEFDSGHAFIERTELSDYAANLQQLHVTEPNARIAWTVEAASHNEAMQALYDRKGWGRYRTIEEELGELEDGPHNHAPHLTVATDA